MGQSWFRGRRLDDYYYARAPTATLPPAADPTATASDVPTHFHRASSSPPPISPPPPAPPASNYYPYNYHSHPQSSTFPPRPPSYPHYYPRPPPDWGQRPPFRPNHPSSSSSAAAAAAPTPPPYVEHRQAKTIKNDVNVRKETIRLEIDEHFPDRHIVSFTFDAAVDGSITIFYFAKEGKDCSFSSVYPELRDPTRIPFQKGSGQKFRQTPTCSIDLGFFELEELSNSSNDIFPLVIYAEAGQQPADEQQQQQQLQTVHSAQITLTVIEKKDDGPFQVKVIKQILRIDGQRYELREIFGIGSSTEAKVDENDGKECIICMSEPSDTTVLPCRHMCLCSECAKTLRLQTNKCPICRQPVDELLEIKTKDDGHQ